MTRKSKREIETALDELEPDAVDAPPDTVDDAIAAAMEAADIHTAYRFNWDDGDREAIRDDAPDGYVPVGIGPSFVWFTPEEYTPAGADPDDLPARLERLGIDFAGVDT